MSISRAKDMSCCWKVHVRALHGHSSGIVIFSHRFYFYLGGCPCIFSPFSFVFIFCSGKMLVYPLKLRENPGALFLF